ncbi:MAG TPA: AtpZ/AtpI family protein [Chitinophagaceae bacterium]
MKQSPLSNKNKRDIYRYASLGTQIMVALAIAVFIGIKADGWLHTLPLFSCALPLLVLTGIFYKLIRDTGNKKNNEQE